MLGCQLLEKKVDQDWELCANLEPVTHSEDLESLCDELDHGAEAKYSVPDLESLVQFGLL